MEVAMRHIAIALSFSILSAPAALAQIGNPAGMAPDTRLESPGVPAPNQTNYQDRLFAQLAAAGGMAEVEFGSLAVERAGNSGVKEFAQRMVEDHGKANDTLKGLADASKIPLPEELDPDHQRQRAELEKLEGAEFDLAYMKGQIVDHQKTTQLLIWEIGSGQDAEIQRFAAATLPTVMRHLEMARHLVAELANQPPAESESQPAAAEPEPQPPAQPEPQPAPQ
jgi:putative membrane protein